MRNKTTKNKVRGNSTRTAVIKKCRQRDQDDRPADQQVWCLYTHDGSKLLGRHPSKEKALKQERAIQMNKQGYRSSGMDDLVGNYIVQVGPRTTTTDIMNDMLEALAAGKDIMQLGRYEVDFRGDQTVVLLDGEEVIQLGGPNWMTIGPVVRGWLEGNWDDYREGCVKTAAYSTLSYDEIVLDWINDELPFLDDTEGSLFVEDTINWSIDKWAALAQEFGVSSDDLPVKTKAAIDELVDRLNDQAVPQLNRESVVTDAAGSYWFTPEGLAFQYSGVEEVATLLDLGEAPTSAQVAEITQSRKTPFRRTNIQPLEITGNQMDPETIVYSAHVEFRDHDAPDEDRVIATIVASTPKDLQQEIDELLVDLKTNWGHEDLVVVDLPQVDLAAIAEGSFGIDTDIDEVLDDLQEYGVFEQFNQGALYRKRDDSYDASTRKATLELVVVDKLGRNSYVVKAGKGEYTIYRNTKGNWVIDTVTSSREDFPGYPKHKEVLRLWQDGRLWEQPNEVRRVKPDLKQLLEQDYEASARGARNLFHHLAATGRRGESARVVYRAGRLSVVRRARHSPTDSVAVSLRDLHTLATEHGLKPNWSAVRAALTSRGKVACDQMGPKRDRDSCDQMGPSRDRDSYSELPEEDAWFSAKQLGLQFMVELVEDEELDKGKAAREAADFVLDYWDQELPYNESDDKLVYWLMDEYNMKRKPPRKEKEPELLDPFDLRREELGLDAKTADSGWMGLEKSLEDTAISVYDEVQAEIAKMPKKRWSASEIADMAADIVEDWTKPQYRADVMRILMDKLPEAADEIDELATEFARDQSYESSKHASFKRRS